jgi:hypothetical protein
MRWVRRIAVFIVLLILAGFGYAAWIGIEFGSRPAESLKPIEIASDIKFIDANGVHFAYIEEGQ